MLTWLPISSHVKQVTRIGMWSVSRLSVACIGKTLRQSGVPIWILLLSLCTKKIDGSRAFSPSYIPRIRVQNWLLSQCDGARLTTQIDCSSMDDFRKAWRNRWSSKRWKFGIEALDWWWGLSLWSGTKIIRKLRLFTLSAAGKCCSIFAVAWRPWF